MTPTEAADVIALRESPARRVPLGYRRARCDGAEVIDGQRGALP